MERRWLTLKYLENSKLSDICDNAIAAMRERPLDHDRYLNLSEIVAGPTVTSKPGGVRQATGTLSQLKSIHVNSGCPKHH